MKRKGFTLIELLATIVVIAIISLIAVPVVTGIIERSRKVSFLRSAENIREISKNYYIQNSAKFSNKNEINFDCDNKECISKELENKSSNLGAEGSMGEGYVKIYKKGEIEFLLSNGKYCAEKNPNKEEVKIYNNGTCEGIVIDNDKIKINSIKTISTTNSIIVYGDVTAGKSGVSRYEFYIDNKLDGTVETTNTSYTHPYTKVSGKNHKIKVKVYNGTYGKPNYDESIGMDEKEIDASLSDFGTITIKPSTTEWASSKTYTISGTTDGAILQYKVVSGTTVKQDWTNYSNAITVDWISTKETPTHIYARFYDGYNTSNGANLDETKIDTTVPSAPTEIKVGDINLNILDLKEWHNKDVYFPLYYGEPFVSGSVDHESGIARYEISEDNINWHDWSDYSLEGVYKASETTVRYYRAINNAGLASEATKVDIKIDTMNPTVSYSLAGGIYNAYKTVRVTPNDENYASMSVHVYKNGEKIDSKSVNGITEQYYDVALDSAGTWTIYAMVYDKAGNKQNQEPKNSSGWYYQTYTIDTTAPTVTLTKGTVTTKSITVVANAKDDETGIKGYQFSMDNGSTWTPVQTNNTYTFGDLKTGTYNIKVKVYNKANLNATSSTLSVSTLAFDKPTFTVSPSGWVSSKKVTITYPQAATIKQYSLDGGKTYTSYNGALTFTSSQSIVAKASDGTNTTINTENILIDTTTPVATITVFNGGGAQVSNGGKIGLNSTSTIRFSCSAGVSGVASYQYNSNHIVGTYNRPLESKTINSTSTTYDYKITPKNLKNSYGEAVKSGTIHHVLTCTNGAGKLSNTATFDTVLVDDSISLTLKLTDKTVSSITATATASSSVGIAKYEFKIDSGSWINNGTSNVYTFNGLAENSTHTIYTRVTNNTGVGAEANISATTGSNVTCSTEGTCTCSNGSYTGSIGRVCRDLNGNIVSSETVHTCSGSCGSGGGGSSGGSYPTTSSCGSHIECGTRSDGTPKYGDCELTCTSATNCTSKLVNCS